ncbi:CD3324 family protein [Paenibacillus sp. JX-17]|uniref:CD3324 family protein n=1 Tax=Paenibacillus lacisoli TaxID=3064525 RepID=A0ABT9CE41_9BACL|nr:CD3324 family protein [Paenibacillus sp. JX-17]MDO7905966.1 CD3324 family protein [Paenibacillus sp. JX-17]
MRYETASGLLPKELLQEIQKYVQGRTIYIPVAAGTRKRWGDTTGYRKQLHERNDEIRRQYHEGQSMDALADTFGLSLDRIRKIVYSRHL